MNTLLRLVIVIIMFTSFWAGASFAQFAPVHVQTTNNVTVHDALASVTDALAKAGAGSEIRAHISGTRDDDVIASDSRPIAAQVDNLTVDKEHNQWQATLLLTAGGKNLAPVKLAGSYEEITQVPVLKHNMGTGEVISQDDIDWVGESAAHLHKNTLTDAGEIIGKSPKHMISLNRPIRREEIAMPSIINKGARIAIIYKTRNLEIRTLGEALDNGAKGDVIRVKNIASKSILQGTIEAADRVRITSPDAASAENTQ
jgi:flagella basal body P-ring formation protein FlgA